jgi:peptidoglycan/xylan/chitin deacetylase (PgdA/CDA1 family)
MIQEIYKVEKVLLFHDVNAGPRMGMQDLNSRYLMDWKKFKNIFELNKDSEYIFEAIDKNLEIHISQNVTRITIDDGGGSCLKIAKFLKKKNIKGYFFIVTNFIGKPHFLDESEIQEIHQMGHIIGSHSHTHPHPFHFLTRDQIISEIKISKDIIERLLNIPVKVFSVPGGEINNKTLRILIDPILGLDEIYISTPYKGNKNFTFSKKTKIYGRLCIEAGMHDSTISKFIAGKGWILALINYQIRRLKREILYRLNLH